MILFVVQRQDCDVFSSADDIDPVYGKELRKSLEGGVEILVYQARVSPHEVRIENPLPYRL